MDLLVGTALLRPYVFAFLALFIAAGVLDLGWRRTLGVTAGVWPVVRGDRWFLGPLFAYEKPGVYFGVPLSNFAGWVIVGALGVGLFLTLVENDTGRRVWPGVALYYAVLGFNLTMTLQIGELLLAVVGGSISAVVAFFVWSIHREPGGVVVHQDQ